MRQRLRSPVGPLLGATLALAAGCGGAAVPTTARTDATAAVHTAREMDAAQQPEAAYHLELADEQLAEAEAHIDEGRMQEAERLLERAEADAELAVALTRRARTARDAEETMQRIEEMRERHL
ncbi:MAG TPA: DUF4398 domain-containing protein [Sandaracinaceae bacterium LLY-WYZ-13_1]|nr:DUF4398 domain-containing protein [Sandaracinaceae bacterium LLY-WYZ-13_1]